jgi:hypothetical protein
MSVARHVCGLEASDGSDDEVSVVLVVCRRCGYLMPLAADRIGPAALLAARRRAGDWELDWAGWATFGFVATVVLSGIMVASQLLGLSRMDIPLMLGTIFVEDLDRARVVGFLIHVVNGQIFALLYAAAFALIGWATWWLGALFGLVHGFAALTVIIPVKSNTS